MKTVNYHLLFYVLCFILFLKKTIYSMKIELSDKQFELIQTIKTYKDVPHRLSDAKFDTLYDEIYNQFHSLHPNIYSSLYNLLIIIDNTLCFVGHKLPQNKIIYNFNTIKSNDNN